MNKNRFVVGYNLSPDQRDDCFSPCEYKSVWWCVCVVPHMVHADFFIFIFSIRSLALEREFLSFDNKFHLLLFH